MEKFTFGKTPAAVYLVDYLSKKNAPILNKRIGKIMTGVRNTLSELEKSNNSGLISAHNLSRLVNLMRSKFEIDVGDEHASNLVTNILVGDMKSLIRRASKIRKVEQHQSRYQNKTVSQDIKNKDGVLIIKKVDSTIVTPKYSVNGILEDINSSTLTDKWFKKHSGKEFIKSKE